MKLILNLDQGNRLGDFLVAGFDSAALGFNGAAAFLRRSGMRHLQEPLRHFSATRPTRVVVGVDLQGTSLEALEMLLESFGECGSGYVFHNPVSRTFHPKIFCFNNSEGAEVYVGSGNLTGGGLHTNHEAGIRLSLARDEDQAKLLISEIDQAFDSWCDVDAPTTVALCDDVIRSLLDEGLIQSERTLIGLGRAAGVQRREGDTLFRGVRSILPPKPAGAQEVNLEDAILLAVEQEPAAILELDSPRFYAMTLQKTDVGVGQTSEGAGRRSPEVFIPLAARNMAPSFWGWDAAFYEDPNKPGKLDRTDVPFHIGGHSTRVNMMTWPDKHDFRLRSEQLRSSGNVGDILVLERSADTPPSYFAEVISQESARYPEYLARCDQPVRSSAKRYGYF